jgi:serine/threonine-protein kinase 24/25/MST4
MFLSHTRSVHDVNDDVLQAIRDDMDAQEIEALSMLSRGFTELKEANPELAYNIVLDILSGINECVIVNVQCQMTQSDLPSNAAVRQHVQTSRGLFPHQRIIRKSEMTAKGLVVTEVQEAIPASASGQGVSAAKNDEPAKRSPIADLLYMRWLEGLRIKWPSLT